MESLKIGLVSTSCWPLVGGMEAYLYRLANSHVENGHDVAIATRFTESRPKDTRALHTSHQSPRSYTEQGVRTDIVAPSVVGKALLPLEYRMHYRASTLGLAKKLVSFAFLSALRRSLSGSDVIHYSGNGREMIGFAAADLARGLDVPLVITPHTHAGHWGDGPIDFDLYRHADRVIALTTDEQDRLTAGGLERDSVPIIGHGVDLVTASGDAFRKKHNIENTTVLFLGRKTGAKGYPLLLKAIPLVLEKHPNTSFVLAGADDPAEQFNDDVLADPRVIDVGILSDEEREEAYAACDVFCLPSIAEAFGLVYVEAWGHRKPVVGVRIPTLVELILGSGGGLLADNTPESLAEAIGALVEDPALRKKLGDAGYEAAAGRPWTKVASDTASVYVDAIAEHRRR
ncbi:MAG: glycosyltransferase family 4 protein [Rhodothermales bacterium]|nr:glycosyltransferase family 4 protein [Rhodothermales bacterium]